MRRRLALRTRLTGTRPGSEVFAPDVHDPASPVVTALGRLSERDREALTLTAWEGLTPSEAAAVLGEPPARFRVRLHRAGARLKRQLAAGSSDHASIHRIAATEELVHD